MTLSLTTCYSTSKFIISSPLSVRWAICGSHCDSSCLACPRQREMVILGTQYAGEMKKGIFTIMHYFMPKRGILSLHSGCNVGRDEDVTLFFGLSGHSPVPRSLCMQPKSYAQAL